MNNVYLIGYMGTGKSTVGSALSSRLGAKLIDMDQVMEKEQAKTINEIFAEEGEEYFRDLETDLLKRLSEQTDLIVSCGGGAPLREENSALMRRSGTVIWLEATPETIYNRLRKDTTRPLLKDNMTQSHITNMLKTRTPSYERTATHRISVDKSTVEDLVSRIIDIL